MEYIATPHPHPYFNDHGDIYRDSEEQQLLASILTGVSREATAFDLYNRLVNCAPLERKHELQDAIDEKQERFSQFAQAYIQLTGSQPSYNIEYVPFHDFEDGLHKAIQFESNSLLEYERCGSTIQNPQIRNIFASFQNGEVRNVVIKDYGPHPFVVDMKEITKKNDTFRSALWTGKHFQITLMNIGVGEDIGLEMHPNVDQYIRIEEGQGVVQMGNSKDRLDYERKIYDDYAVVIPAGKWHNLKNTGNSPLKLYSIYAPPNHPFGTVHRTKQEAMEAEEHHH